MRNAMEKEIKNERPRGNGRELAFTLMPLYALGVGMFAAYKLLKVNHRKIIRLLWLGGNVTAWLVCFSTSKPVYMVVPKPFLALFDLECEVQS